MPRFVIQARAQLDWLECFEYLRRRSSQSAERFSDAVRETIRQIRSNPAFGARLPRDGHEEQEWRRLTVRGFKKYQVVYHCTPETTKVIRILHVSRDIEAALRLS